MKASKAREITKKAAKLNPIKYNLNPYYVQLIKDSAYKGYNYIKITDWTPSMLSIFKKLGYEIQFIEQSTYVSTNTYVLVFW